MQITVARTRSNDPEVHSADCADVKRGRQSGKYQDADTIEVTEVEDGARWFWVDFLPGGCAFEEGGPGTGMTDDDAQGYTKYLPCTNGLNPKEKDMTAETTTKPTAPKAPRAPRTTKRSPKPGVTNTVPAKPKTIELPEDKNEQPTPTPKRNAKQELARKVVEAVANLGLSPEDAATAAQWLHHLPTGSDGEGRYWPASLPRPNRSDWK